MMSEIKNKVDKEITKWRQLLLLDDDGFIMASCDSIFSSKSMRDNPVFVYFPLLESIFQDILQLQPHDSEIRFSKVESTNKCLPGFYDFTFYRTDIDSSLPILWTIYDYTDLYEDYMRYQQRKHEILLAQELLKSR